jgi:alanine transaminase
MHHDVKMEFKKILAAHLCSPVIGQVVIDTIVNPPKPGDPSYALFIKVE